MIAQKDHKFWSNHWIALKILHELPKTVFLRITLTFGSLDFKKLASMPFFWLFCDFFYEPIDQFNWPLRTGRPVSPEFNWCLNYEPQRQSYFYHGPQQRHLIDVVFQNYDIKKCVFSPKLCATILIHYFFYFIC